ncbi:MAG TPA: hypothetical protein VMR81_00860 [Patescibacteria group bacterium]|jgi:hypothetical protein|nr:hypothetical protein [Patescibacteria group bacterium]
MKKIFLLPALFLLFPSIVFATSGCCSGHSGVNCGVGPQGNGNVICNDGWTGSSCSYASMVMCGGSTNNTVTTQAPVVTVPPTRYILPPAAYAPIATYTPTPLPTEASAKVGTVTLTPAPTEITTPTATPTAMVTVTATPTYMPPQPATTPSFQWWNVSPMMTLLGAIFQWK